MAHEKLNLLLQPLVEDLGYEFVGLEYSSNPKNALLRIYIDTEAGVNVDDCERVSREVAALLDVEDPISGHYNLEISSPGLDRPLFTPEHYRQMAGQQVRINVFAPVEGRRKFKGTLLTADDQMITLNQDGNTVAIEFSNIAKGRLLPDYQAVLKASSAGRRRQDG